MVVNLMSTDALVIMETLPQFMAGILAPIQIGVTLGLLSKYIGPYGLISLAVALLVSPLIAHLAGSMGKQRFRMQSHSDSRLRYIKELLTSIRIIKYYAWEKPFLKHIEGAREQQLKFVRRIQLTRALLMTVLTNVASIGIGLTFFSYGITHTMDYKAIFSAMTFLSMLRNPFNFLPMLLAYFGQYTNSFDRITFFALSSEIKPNTNRETVDGIDKGMKIENASFAWETALSIAETRFLDLETYEANLNQQIETAPDSQTKLQLIGKMKTLLGEKEYIGKAVRNARLQERRSTREKITPRHNTNSSNNTNTNTTNTDNNSSNSSTNSSETENNLNAQQSNRATTDTPPQTPLSVREEEEEFEVEEVITPEEQAKYQPLRKVAPTLKNISLLVKPGRLTAVVGSVGSGKSTLALAFLGEIQPTTGSVDVHAQVAYAAQEAWILNATVRDNITFGRPYDPEWYSEVIFSCALGPDIATFHAGDMTEIGERGSNLSGGQRQRINVARAMYARCPILILDDPFSAVDSHVAAHMFQHVAQGMRNAGHTVLLITNQLHFVPEVEYVVVLKGGRIIEQGHCQALLKLQHGFLKKMLVQHVVHKTSEEDMNESGGKLDAPPSPATFRSPRLEVTPEQDEANRQKGTLFTDEERKMGNIALRVYWNYCVAGGLWLILLMFLMQALRIGSRIMWGVWLSWWSDPKNAHGFSPWVYRGGYISLVAAEALFTLFGSLFFLKFAMNAARSLHTNMLIAVSRATISWYDHTPIGRILTRFSKDIDLVDIKLPQVVEQIIFFALRFCGVAGAIAVGSYWLLILLAVALVTFLGLVFYYRPTSIQVQRLEALSRAPIYSHLTETIDGASTIRAYRMTQAFQVANMNKIDRNNVDFIALRYCSSWYGVTQDLAGSLFVSLSIVALVIVRTYIPNSIPIGYMILALSNMGSISASLSDLASTIADLENKMNSAERVLEFSELPLEAPAEIPETKPPTDWPQRGAITFEDLTIRYSDDASSAAALIDINCKIKPQERIGIVGRTGAGKSTLVTALFRTTEPSHGTLTIDGLDISQIGLFDLRSRISIIPQTPQLFTGTVRFNLDPFEERTDHELWMALKMVRLKDYIAALPGCLSEYIEEGGTNFSVGQRQLLSMARCLLKGTHVLVLDEATSAVDVETDALLQCMIRNNFPQTTVLTIAHRLNTIMDYDRIMVLDKGTLAEFDTPKNLLLKPDSMFASMVEATGPETAEYLRSIAFGETSFMEALTALVQLEDATPKAPNPDLDDVVEAPRDTIVHGTPETDSVMTDDPSSPDRPARSGKSTWRRSNKRHSSKRASFQQLSRRQQSKLALGYYKVEQEDVLENAKTRATLVRQQNRASKQAGITRDPSVPPSSSSSAAADISVGSAAASSQNSQLDLSSPPQRNSRPPKNSAAKRDGQMRIRIISGDTFTRTSRPDAASDPKNASPGSQPPLVEHASPSITAVHAPRGARGSAARPPPGRTVSPSLRSSAGVGTPGSESPLLSSRDEDHAPALPIPSFMPSDIVVTGNAPPVSLATLESSRKNSGYSSGTDSMTLFEFSPSSSKRQSSQRH